MTAPSRIRPAFAPALAAVAGFADAVGFLVLHGLFTAHMSGNTAKLGARLGQGDLSAALPLIAAVALFVTGIALGTTISELAVRRGLRSVNALLLGLQALLLVAFMGYGATVVTARGETPGQAGAFYALTALAIVALSLQTTTVQRLSGQRLRTTFVTGVLASLSQELVNLAFWARDGASRDDRASYLSGPLGLGDRRQARARAVELGAVWVSYLAGAVLGGYLQGAWSVWAMSVPVATLVAIIAADLVTP